MTSSLVNLMSHGACFASLVSESTSTFSLFGCEISKWLVCLRIALHGELSLKAGNVALLASFLSFRMTASGWLLSVARARYTSIATSGLCVCIANWPEHYGLPILCSAHHRDGLYAAMPLRPNYLGAATGLMALVAIGRG